MPSTPPSANRAERFQAECSPQSRPRWAARESGPSKQETLLTTELMYFCLAVVVRTMLIYHLLLGWRLEHSISIEVST